MLFGDTIAITLSIIGFLASLQGLWLVCRAMFPAAVERATVRCEKNAIKSFFVGLLITGAFIIAVIVLSKLAAPGQMISAGLGMVFLFYAGIGMSGLATLVGKRLPSPVDADRPWRGTLRGGVVLNLIYLFPVLGWFGVLPITLILGAGATTLALLARRPTGIDPLTTDIGYRMAPARPDYSAAAPIPAPAPNVPANTSTGPIPLATLPPALPAKMAEPETVGSSR